MNRILKSVIGFSLKNRFFILFCTVILVMAGIITYKSMPIEAFPDVTNTEISIITQWPGRSAEEVEKFITIPIEMAMNPVQRKVSLRSTSIFGLSYVKLIFDDEVKDPEARQQVFWVHGLGEEVEGTQVEGPPLQVAVLEARNDDDREAAPARLGHGGQQLQAVHVRHLHIRYHDIGGVGLEEVQRQPATTEEVEGPVGMDAMQDAPVGVQYALFVVHKKDRAHETGCSWGGP